MPKRRSPSKSVKRIRKDDVPASAALVKEVRSELLYQLSSHDKKFQSIDKRFDSIDNRFDSIDKRFESIDKRFQSVDKRFDFIENKIDSVEKRLEAKIDEVKSEVHVIRVLVEEQQSNNRIVLDGINTLLERQSRLEMKFHESAHSHIPQGT